MEYSDYELVYMVKENEEALSYMVKKYEPLFNKMAYSFLLRNPNKGLDFDDIVQQCRIAMCYALDRFDDRNEILFYSYLLVCLRRSIWNYSRTYLNRPDVYYYMDIENYDSIDEFIDGVNIEQEAIDRDFDLELVGFKHSLDSLDSCIFELRYNGFMYEEIASLLEISTKKVDNSLLKVRKKLEKYFLFQ